MKKIPAIFILMMLLLNGFAQPIITSFTPLSAAKGSLVTISGTGFNPVAAGNIVYFGNVKATVSSATATSIVVTVPGGANYQPISVTDNGLTAFSVRPFLLSFPGGGPFTSNALSPAQPVVSVYKQCYADLDNDENLDVAGESMTNNLLVYRNTASPGEFSFAPTGLQLNATYINCVTAADMNGDGKLDLIVSMSGSTGLLIYKNTSTPGVISFDAAPFVYNLINYTPAFITTADLDANGKTDIIASVEGSNNLNVFANTSTGGNFSLGPKQQFGYGFGGSSEKVYTSDVDGDNKPDVTVSSNYFTPLVVLRNTSIPGTINFAASVPIASGRSGGITGGSQSLNLGDVDGDGKMDMALTYPYADSFFIFRNTSSAGTVSFAPRVAYKTVTIPRSVALNDFDGDAKPDIAVLGTYDTIALHKNNSSSGTISLGSRNNYRSIYIDQFGEMTHADADADGKTDLIISYYSTNSDTKTVYVLRNQVASPVVYSAIPYTASQGQTVTLRGDRFINVTGVSFGNVPAASFAVLSDTVMTAVVGNGTSGNITVTTATGIFKYPGFTFTLPVPAIDSIVPRAGNMGSTTIIHGKNFSTVPAENVVYFGSGKATVTASTATTITVKVPAYASYTPVTITRLQRNLTAYSRLPFNITFPVTQNLFTNTSFSDTVRYATTETVSSICPADFDGDIKTDFAVSEANSTIQMSVFRNQAIDGNLSFAPRKTYKVSEGTVTSLGRPLHATTADINGDGLTDIVASSGTRDSISVLLNGSVPGTLSFPVKKDFLTGDEPSKVKCADLDLDGKPDILVVNGAVRTISIYKNISDATNVIMQPRVDLPVTGSWVYDVVCFDMDGDGKPEIASPVNNADTIVIFKNGSTPGTMSFANRLPMFSGTGSFFSLSNADLDGDGKQDMIGTNGAGFSIFRNISTPGNIAFSPRVDSALSIYDYTVADMNGDGKPDLIFCNGDNNLIYIYPNQSTPGSISFGQRVDYPSNFGPNKINTADFTGDGKPDLVFYSGGYRVFLRKNLFGDTAAIAACPPSANTTIQSNLAGVSYQWQVNNGTGYVNLSNGPNYNGTTTRTLQLTNLPTSNYGNIYRCIVDGNNSEPTILRIQNKWLGGTGGTWETPSNWSCGAVPDGFTDVIINWGSVVINSNVNVRSIIVNNPATLSVNPGFNLSVSH